MQLFQLITLVGLTLSHVRAMPPVLPTQQFRLIEQVVTLITRPDIMIKNTPELKAFEGMATQSPGLFDNQIRRGIEETLTSLRSVGDHHTQRLFNSIAAYHNAADPISSEFYRNAIYSRMVDLTHANPEVAQQHLEMAYKRLRTNLDLQVTNFEAAHLEPMGNKQAIGDLHKFLARFKTENHEEIQKYTQSLLAHLPSARKFGPMQYLTIDEVERVMQRTNPHRIHAPAAHQANPTVAHAPQAVAAPAA